MPAVYTPPPSTGARLEISVTDTTNPFFEMEVEENRLKFRLPMGPDSNWRYIEFDEAQEMRKFLEMYF